jgi:flagellar hook-length control protein FliK
MRIDDTPPPAANSDPKSSEADSSRTDDQKDGTSPFSKVLAKKREPREESESSKRGLGRQEGDSASFPALQMPTDLAQQMPAEGVTAKRSVELPVQLQQLVHEISVVAGKHQVHIEMNSNVLKGLQIHIENRNGAVAIQFLSDSPTVTTLLSSNLGMLSEGLAERGVNVSDSTDTSNSSSSGEGRASSARFARGGQGQGRRG